MAINAPFVMGTITPKRRTSEFGEPQWNPLPQIDVWYALGEPQPIMSENSWRYTQDGDLFADRGVDLKDGDMLPLNEGNFGVIGGPQWDFVHPMTGYNFGKALFKIRRGG